MRSHTVDGVFLDVIGAKNWGPPAKWNDDTEWTEAQRDAWTYGCVDLVRKLDASRRAINPNFLIINNGLWDRSGNDPLHKGNEGQQYVDGVRSRASHRFDLSRSLRQQGFFRSWSQTSAGDRQHR